MVGRETTGERDTAIRAALVDLLGLLWDREIPYQVVGGLAARAHGATRTLVDVDVFVPDEGLDTIAEVWRDAVTRPPHRHVGDQWDVRYARFEVQGVPIEVGSTHRVAIQGGRSDRWHELAIDLKHFELRQAFGVSMKVMPLNALVSYKHVLNRPVDRQDLAAIVLGENAAGRFAHPLGESI